MQTAGQTSLFSGPQVGRGIYRGRGRANMERNLDMARTGSHPPTMTETARLISPFTGPRQVFGTSLTALTGSFPIMFLELQRTSQRQGIMMATDERIFPFTGRRQGSGTGKTATTVPFTRYSSVQVETNRQLVILTEMAKRTLGSFVRRWEPGIRSTALMEQ